MYAMYVYNICMEFIYAMYVWNICMQRMYAMYVCNVCTQCMNEMYVCNVCMQLIYAIFAIYAIYAIYAMHLNLGKQTLMLRGQWAFNLSSKYILSNLFDNSISSRGFFKM